jgi:RNA polymerase primary sigma factor
MADKNKGEKSGGTGSNLPVIDDELVALVESLPPPDEFADRVIAALPQAKAMKIYLKEIGRFPVLSESEELDLVKRIQEMPDAKTRKRLNEANIRLVSWIAKEYANGETSLADLINDGTLGLANSVSTFDSGAGISFRMHAAFWIKKAVSEAVAFETSMSRIPDYLLEKIESVKPVSQKLMATMGREPTREEVADELGLSVDELERLIKLVGHAPSNEDAAEIDEEEQELIDNNEFYENQDYD